MKYDIDISGRGFYIIQANTKRGRTWMAANVEGTAEWGGVPCDDMNYTANIADGAISGGLSVRVNGKRYLGQNRVAA